MLGACAGPPEGGGRPAAAGGFAGGGPLLGELAKFRLISFGSLFSLLKVGRECAPHRHAPHQADVPVERCRRPTSVVWLSCVAPRCATAQVARFAVAHEVHVTRPGPPSTLSTRRSQMSNNPSQQLLWGGAPVMELRKGLHELPQGMPGSLGITCTWPLHTGSTASQPWRPACHLLSMPMCVHGPAPSNPSDGLVEVGCGMPGWWRSLSNVPCKLAARHWGHYKPCQGPRPCCSLLAFGRHSVAAALPVLHCSPGQLCCWALDFGRHKAAI